jgi:hypothetical protein
MSILAHYEPHSWRMPPPFNYEPRLIVAFPCAFKSVGQCYLPWLPHAADGRRAQTAGRRYTIAYQTVPPTPPDPTTPALLPSRNQRPRHLSALCWQEAACMERWCRSSAVQAEQALG